MTSTIESKTNDGETEGPIDKDQYIYFIVLFPGEQVIDLNESNCISNYKPKVLYEDKIEIIGKTFATYKVFEFIGDKKENKKKNEKEKNLYQIKYEIGHYGYNISFDAKNNSFIYDIDFKKRNKYLDNIPETNIEQNSIIQLYKKLEIFKKALEKKDEKKEEKKQNDTSHKEEKRREKQIDILYKETIYLYKRKNNFNLLISLFLNIYENNDLCPTLLSVFYEKNEKGNTDRDEDLAQKIGTFKSLYLNANNIINRYEYDEISFIGIILCYLNYYDNDKDNNILSKYINELFESCEEKEKEDKEKRKR